MFSSTHSGADRENESFISVAISFLCPALNGFYEEDEEEELGESMRVIIYSYMLQKAIVNICCHIPNISGVLIQIILGSYQVTNRQNVTTIVHTVTSYPVNLISSQPAKR